MRSSAPTPARRLLRTRSGRGGKVRSSPGDDRIGPRSGGRLERELRASRARIVAAGDQERRRLERDLHDGAQQRLLALGLALQLARAPLGPQANGAAELLGEADAELRAALDELRELARGIHPAVLTELGLEAALATLAERSPVRVTSPRPHANGSPRPPKRPPTSSSARRSRTLPSTRTHRACASASGSTGTRSSTSRTTASAAPIPHTA